MLLRTLDKYFGDGLEIDSFGQLLGELAGLDAACPYDDAGVHLEAYVIVAAPGERSLSTNSRHPLAAGLERGAPRHEDHIGVAAGEALAGGGRPSADDEGPRLRHGRRPDGSHQGAARSRRPVES